MNKFFSTLALIVLTTLATHAQGTIAFGNSALTRVHVREPDGLRYAHEPDYDLVFAVYFGPAGSARDALAQVDQPNPKATIGTTAGVMINAPSVYALPGTEPGQVVSLQIRAWGPQTGGLRLYGETDVRQVTLGPTAGPGTVIWQTATGTNPNRFTPLIAGPIPEPSTIVLAAIGLSSLLLFRRRKSLR